MNGYLTSRKWGNGISSYCKWMCQIHFRCFRMVGMSSLLQTNIPSKIWILNWKFPNKMLNSIIRKGVQNEKDCYTVLVDLLIHDIWTSICSTFDLHPKFMRIFLKMSFTLTSNSIPFFLVWIACNSVQRKITNL